MVLPALLRGLAARPPLADRNSNGGPRVLSYRVEAMNNTNNEDVSTVSGVNIGTAHPDRVVVLVMYLGQPSATPLTAQVNGYDPYFVYRASSWFITCHKVPTTDTTATIRAGVPGSIRKSVEVYSAYPLNPMPLDQQLFLDPASTTSSTVTPAAVSVGGGCAVSGGGSATNSGFNFSLSNNSGVDSTSRDVNSNVAAVTYCSGSLINTRSGNFTHTMAKNGSNCTGRYEVVTFGPPSSYVGI